MKIKWIMNEKIYLKFLKNKKQICNIYFLFFLQKLFKFLIDFNIFFFLFFSFYIFSRHFLFLYIYNYFVYDSDVLPFYFYFYKIINFLLYIKNYFCKIKSFISSISNKGLTAALFDNLTY